jgi:hypothetical protein
MPSPAIQVTNSGSGDAIYGRNNGGAVGVRGYGKPGVMGVGAGGAFSSGVKGRSTKGKGVTGASTENIGVWGKSSWVEGVLGESTYGHGVRGESTWAYGVRGESTYSTGVWGVATDPEAFSGVHGETNSIYSSDAGVEGHADNEASGVEARNYNLDDPATASYGLRASSNNSHGIYSTGGSGSGDYGGYFTGFGGILVETAETEPGQAVYATSGDAEAGYFDAANDDGVRAFGHGAGFNGVYAYGADGYGVWGNSGVVDGYGLYTSDRIYTGGGCVGCTSMIIAQNGSDATLEPGDVVAVLGIAEPPSESYARPVLLVTKADVASSQGVVGVVEGRYVVELITDEEARIETHYEEIVDPEGKHEPDRVPVHEVIVEEVTWENARATTEPVPPGERMTIVYRGLTQVKADASLGAVAVGDLVFASGGAGFVAKAPTAADGGALASGTIIGKALEPLAEGQGLIWVLVDLQ